MLHIQLRVDENIIARIIINISKTPVDFANYLWDKYRISYMKLQKNIKENIDGNILKEVKAQEFFIETIIDTINYLTILQKYWKQK